MLVVGAGDIAFEGMAIFGAFAAHLDRLHSAGATENVVTGRDDRFQWNLAAQRARENILDRAIFRH